MKNARRKQSAGGHEYEGQTKGKRRVVAALGPFFCSWSPSSNPVSFIIVRDSLSLNQSPDFRRREYRVGAIA